MKVYSKPLTLAIQLAQGLADNKTGVYIDSSFLSEMGSFSVGVYIYMYIV